MNTQDLAPWATAQRLAWAPLMFQAARAARDLNVLATVEKKKGAATYEEVATATGLTLYAVGVLLDSCEALELIERKENKFRLLPAGWLVQYDKMTRIHMDFTNDVCWRGAEHLQDALKTGTPSGLKELSPAPNIYEALTVLPGKSRESWFNFDHFYSDQVFPLAKPIIATRKPESLLDVGGNTGRWALKIAAEVPVTILDHPGQLRVAAEAAKAAGLEGRVKGIEMNLLDHSKPFPQGFDAVWMSQFLCCFGLEDVVALLKRGAKALTQNGRLYVLDTFWDRQPNPVATYSLHATSVYFTCMANGTSRMYSAKDLLKCIAEAGLMVEEDTHLGVSHTLLVCRPAK